MTRLRRALAWIFALLGWLLLVVEIVRQGGCDRDPPDEPVPADCKPGDNVCNAGKPGGAG